MYNEQETAFIIKQTAKTKNITIKQLLENCNLSINTVSELSKGKRMSYISFAKIAEALDCSMDYLMGRTDNPEVTYNNHALSGDGGVAVAGGNANITISNQQKEDTELLDLIKSLPLKNRVKIISMIYEELEEEK